MTSHLPPIKMCPGVAGMSWKPNRFWKSPAESPIPLGSPVLSIVTIKLLPGLSVLAISSPAGKSWLATVEYISSIPGHTSLYWGTESNKDQEVVCLLIQWEDAVYWRKFQMSMGISLMVDVMAGNPTNRCLRISLRSITAPKILKLFWVVFGNEEAVEEKEKFIEKWAAFKNLRERESEAIYSGWLEPDGAGPSKSEPDDRIDALKNKQDVVFCGIVLKDGEEEEVEVAEAESRDLGELTASFAGPSFKIALEIFAPPTAGYSSIQALKSISPSSAQKLAIAKSLSSLLLLSPSQCYSKRNGINQKVDSKQAATVREVWAGKRLFPGPHGDFTQMGDLHQYMDPPLPHFRETKEGEDFEGTLIWLNFPPGTLDSKEESGIQLQKEFLNFRSKVRSMGSCRSLFWGRCEETSDKCALIVYWKSPSDRTSSSQSFDETLSHFIEKISLTQEPRSFNFRSQPMVATRDYPLLEFTTFKVPNDPLKKFLLSQFYHSFERTTMINAHSGSPISTACVPKCHFFHDQCLSASASAPSSMDKEFSTVYFTGVMGWRSVEAMQEWYADFAAGLENYERLGHKVDALRLLCASPQAETIMLNIVEEPRGSRGQPFSTPLFLEMLNEDKTRESGFSE